MAVKMSRRMMSEQHRLSDKVNVPGVYFEFARSDGVEVPRLELLIPKCWPLLDTKEIA